MATTKVTFTLDPQTIHRIENAAARLGRPKSQVVREAISDYHERIGRLSDSEKQRMLKILDEFMAQPPTGTQADVDRELREIRRARRHGGRRTRVE